MSAPDKTTPGVSAGDVMAMLSVLMVPLAFGLTLVGGVWTGNDGLYTGLPVPIYSALMYLSWVPFVLFGVLNEVLFLNPVWSERRRTVVSSLFHYLLLWFSAAWAGSVTSEAWRVLPLGSAIFQVPLALLMLYLAIRGALTTLTDSPAMDAQDAGQHDVPSATAEPGSYARTTPYEFEWTQPKGGLDAVAGMADLKAELNQALRGFREYGDGGPAGDRNGILLSGPPGNGKTTMAHAIAGELGLPLVKLGCQDLSSKWVNESPAVVKDLFRQARAQPCVLFFDEFDGVAMSRGHHSAHGEDRKLVNALLSEIDRARQEPIVLIAATNYLEQLDAAIIRDGRFDFKIEITYPDQVARVAILRGLLQRLQVNATEPAIAQVAQLWERRSVAFIEATVKRLRDNGHGVHGGVASVADFKLAARQASRRTSAIPQTGAKLSELVLPAAVRREADSLLYRLRHWEDLAQRGGEAPSGVLLYGPPGTGKTHFVRALARELQDWHVFEVNTADILQDPRQFRDVLELAANHRPAIVFIDEADELLRERTQSASSAATNEILKGMDGLMGKVPEVVFMAATNNPHIIDAAALRGGRFAEKIYMGRLQGIDLQRFLAQDFLTKDRVRFAPDLNPISLANRLGEAAPSDALSLLRKAINYSLGHTSADRAVSMADIEAAIESLQLQLGSERGDALPIES